MNPRQWTIPQLFTVIVVGIGSFIIGGALPQLYIAHKHDRWARSINACMAMNHIGDAINCTKRAGDPPPVTIVRVRRVPITN